MPRRSSMRTGAITAKSCPRIGPLTVARAATWTCAAPARSGLGRRRPFGRPTEGAENPEDREENSEEEQPSVPVSKRHQSERERHDEIQDCAPDSNSPPHDSSSLMRGYPPALRSVERERTFCLIPLR